MVLLPLLALAPVWADDCAEPVAAEELVSRAEEARAAWLAMDRAAFDRATVARRSALPCVAEPIAPEQALAYHLAEALAWSLERRSDLDSAELRAVLAIDASWELPLDLAPEQHRLREDYLAARAAPGAAELRPVTVPAGGLLIVDGQVVVDMPVDRPFIAQVADAGGQVAQSGYFGPEAGGVEAQSAWLAAALPAPAAPPTLVEAPTPAPLPEAPPVSPVPRDHSGLALMGGGAGLGLLAGGLYAVAALRAGALERGEVPCGEIDDASGQINGLVAGAGGVGIVAVGLLGAGLMVQF